MTATSNARELLDAYAYSHADPDGECAHDCDDHRGRQAPKAFAAVRAVLDEVDTWINAEISQEEAAKLIRQAISTALEAS